MRQVRLLMTELYYSEPSNSNIHDYMNLYGRPYAQGLGPRRDATMEEVCMFRNMEVSTWRVDTVVRREESCITWACLPKIETLIFCKSKNQMSDFLQLSRDDIAMPGHYGTRYNYIPRYVDKYMTGWYCNASGGSCDQDLIAKYQKTDFAHVHRPYGHSKTVQFKKNLHPTICKYIHDGMVL